MSDLNATPQALPTHVRLVGGPPMWDGATLDPKATDADELYAILQVTDTAQLPERSEQEDTNPSAVYGPIPDTTHPDDLAEWYFRGWWPHSPTDPSPHQYLADYLLTKAAQEGEQVRAWLDRHHQLVVKVASRAELSGEVEMAVRLRQSLHTYLAQGENLEMAVRNAEEAVAGASALGRTSVLAEQLLELASAHRRYGDHEQAVEAAQQALDLDLTVDQRSHARYALAMSLAWAGEHARALEAYERLHTDYDALDAGLQAAVVNGLAWSLSELGRAGEALPYAQRAVELARGESGDERTLAAALDTLGQVQATAGNTDQARVAYREALELYRSLGYQVRIDQVLDALQMLEKRV